MLASLYSFCWRSASQWGKSVEIWCCCLIVRCGHWIIAPEIHFLRAKMDLWLARKHTHGATYLFIACDFTYLLKNNQICYTKNALYRMRREWILLLGRARLATSTLHLHWLDWIVPKLIAVCVCFFLHSFATIARICAVSLIAVSFIITTV